MDRLDKAAVVAHDAEDGETRFQLDCAFVVVGNTGDAARVDNILGKSTRHGDCERLSLAAAGPCQHHAMTSFVHRGVLLRISRQISQRAHQR